MSATLAQLLNVHSQYTDSCLAYLDAVIKALGRQPLLERFGRSLDENGLRIPLHVEPFDVAKFRDEEARRQRERDNVSMQAGDVEAEKRIYAHRGGMDDDSERRDRPKPEPLDSLLDTLEVAMILGDPGGGKSEALKGLAVRTARSVRGQLDQHHALPDDVCLPVFAELPAVARLFGDRRELKALREFACDWLELGAAVERTSRRSGRTPVRALPVLDHPLRLRVSILKAAVKRLGLDFNDQAVRETHSPALRKIWRDWTRPRPPGTKPHPGALLLLDAWDEVPDPFRTDEFKAELHALSREPPARLLATSRIVGFEPGVLDVPATSKPGAVRRELTILPFRYEHTEQFIRAFFPARATADRLIADLRPKPMIMAMLQNPLLATLVCLAFDPASPRPVPLPARRTAVYRGVVQRLLGEEEAVRKESVKRPDEVVVELDHGLQHLAFFVFPDEIFTKATLKSFCDQFTNSNEWKKGCPALEPYLKQRGKTLFACLAECGLLSAHGEMELKFLHLTFEEFFAGGRLAAAVNKNRAGWAGATVPLRGRREPVPVSVFIDRKAWHPRWREVIALAAGQLDPKDAPVEPLLETLTAGEDSIHHHRLCLAMLCLAEASTFNCDADGTAARLGRRAWELFKKRDDSMIADRRLCQYLGVANPPLEGSASVLDVLATILRDRNASHSVRGSAVYAVHGIGGAAGTREFLSTLATILRDRNASDETRGSAAEAVHGIGAAAGTPEFLSALAVILRDAAEAAHGIGTPAVTSEILSKRVTIRVAIPRDPNASDDMRARAASAVGGIDAAADTPEILSALAGIQNDPKLSHGMQVCAASAASAVGGIGAAAGTPEILSALAVILRDANASHDIRRSAAEAVRGVGAPAGTPEILSALATILGDHHAGDDRRRSAAEAVRGVGAPAGTPEILSALATILGDRHASNDMRQSAAEAVRGIGTLTGTPQFLSALADVLSDPNASNSMKWTASDLKRDIAASRFVRPVPPSAQAAMLGNIAPSPFVRPVPPSAQAAMLTLRDASTSDDVRESARDAVCNIGAAAGTPENLSTLAFILSDPNASDAMRRNARDAVRGIGAAAGTRAFLDALADCPNSEDVRHVLRQFVEWRWFDRAGFPDKRSRRSGFARIRSVVRQFIESRWFKRSGKAFTRVPVEELSDLPPSPRP